MSTSGTWWKVTEPGRAWNFRDKWSESRKWEACCVCWLSMHGAKEGNGDLFDNVNLPTPLLQPHPSSHFLLISLSLCNSTLASYFSFPRFSPGSSFTPWSLSPGNYLCLKCSFSLTCPPSKHISIFRGPAQLSHCVANPFLNPPFISELTGPSSSLCTAHYICNYSVITVFDVGLFLLKFVEHRQLCFY